MANTVKNLNPAETLRLKKEELRAKIEEITRISTIPSMMKKIMEVAEDPASAIADLEKLIERDPAIASRVVAVSNAVFYGFPRKINSISQAIMVLGFEMVKGLAVSTAIFNIKQPRFSRELSALWTHSFECAMASVLLARQTGLVTKESAFLAGLLQDIGKPLMIQACTDGYIEAFSRRGLTTEKEEESFGASHAETGAWFAEKCKLPADCVTAIRHHHAPGACAKEELSGPALGRIAYLSNIMAKDDKEARATKEFEETLKAISVSFEDYEKLCVEFAELKSAAASFA